MRIRPVPLSFRVVALAILLAAGTTPVTVQTTVTVSGTVTDGDDRPIAGVTVEFIDMVFMPAATAATDGEGRYSVQLMAGTYGIRATAPAGSGFTSANLPPTSITQNTTINIALVAAGGTILTGRVLDGAGGPVADVNVSLLPALPGLPMLSTLTDAGGNYRLEAARGQYSLSAYAWRPLLEPNRPQTTRINIWSLSLDADRVLDLRIPVHQVTVHVQDMDGSAVAGVGLSASGMENCSIVFDGMSACVSSSYSYMPGPPMPGMPENPQPVTSASGDFTMWLVPLALQPSMPPMPPTGGYTITATPPAGLDLPATAVQNVEVTGDRTVTITLQRALELRGRVLDGAGMPIAGASMSLQPTVAGPPMLSTQTDMTGTYRFSAPAGTYSLSAWAWQPLLEPYRPQSASINIWSLSLDANRVLDLRIPVHQVNVHVQDADGNAVAGVGLSASGTQNCSIVFDGMSACVSASYSYTSAPPMPGMPGNPQPVTNASGDFTMWLVPLTAQPSMPPMPSTGGYTITATPPPALGLPATAIQNVEVTGDTTVTITLQGALELGGRFLDAAGIPIAGAYVSLQPGVPGLPPLATQTDVTGSYRFSATAGTYSLFASAWLPWLAPNRPQSMNINIWSLPLTADRVLDLTVPLHRVEIHVQDATARPVAGVGLSASSLQNCQVVFGGLSGCVTTSYSFYPGPPMPGFEYPQPITDAAGNFTMWLAAMPLQPPAMPGMPPLGGYTFLATPPAGSPFNPFALANMAIEGPTEILIALQYVHPSPVSSAVLSPAPDANGEYPDPVQVTLASAATPGHSIARIEYQVDGGAVQTYAGSFAVAGGGAHELRFWAADTSGVYEVPQVLTFTIESVPTLPEIRETLAGLFASGAIDNEGVFNSLAVKLRDEGQLLTFLHELSAQRGKHISEAAYARLTGDVRKLMTQ